MKNNPKPSAPPSCSLCGQYHLPVIACETGYVCELCAEKTRQGKDGTTRAVKTLQRSLRGKAERERAQFQGSAVDEALDYEIASSELLAMDAFLPSAPPPLVLGGEVLPQHDLQLVDTLATPNAMALDASAHRLDLVTSMGTDVAAMALDTADTMGASNSLEKMLAHQLALLHETAMRYASKAALEQDPANAVRMMNLSIRCMETYQKGMLTLKRLRGTGEQRITIQHVNVTQGGQAVIGQVQAGGAGAKP